MEAGSGGRGSAWWGRLAVVAVLMALVGSSGRAAEPAPKAQTYQVQPGDTLWGIARRFGLTVADLRAANGLVEGSPLRAGEVLTIPAPSEAGAATAPAPGPAATRAGSERRYTVQPGDYPLKIARQFGLSVHDLQAANHLAPDAVLQAGQVLVLPPPTAPPPTHQPTMTPFHHDTMTPFHQIPRCPSTPGVQPPEEAAERERGRISGARKRRVRLRPREEVARLPTAQDSGFRSRARSPSPPLRNPKSEIRNQKEEGAAVSAPAVTRPELSRPEPAPASPPSAPSAPASERTRPELTPREWLHGLALARTAESYLGVPFQFGGTSREGLDCSGLVFLVGQEHGLALPRTVAGQFQCGQPVERAGLRPGDLVFFNTNGRGASHVGVYLGGGEFIHVETTRYRQAIVSRLEEPYYRERYVGARRVNAEETGESRGTKGR